MIEVKSRLSRSESVQAIAESALRGDLCGGFSGPLHSADRVAGDVYKRQLVDSIDHRGFFFHRLAPPANGADPVRLHILSRQLPPPFGHGVWVRTEKFLNLPIAAQTERLKAGVQTSLLLVEQAGEQDDRRTQLVGNTVGRRADRCGGVRQRLPCPQLLLPRSRIDGAAQI